MTVANLSFSGAWGGLEMSSVKYTRLFHQAGYRSFEICQPDSPIHKTLIEQGLAAKTVTARNYFSPHATLAIRKWLKEEKVEALFIHSTKDIWLVTPALAGLPDVKLYAFARMFIRGVNKKDPLHTLMYSRLNGMIALSHVQKAALKECLPIPEEKYLVIPNGVDVERFQPRPRREDIRRQWGFDESHLLFGLVGRLDKQKGSLEFVEAAAQTIKQQPNARFIIVGGNTLGEGDFDRQILERLRALDLQGRLILTDFRKDIEAVMNALDVFVMPSYEENFGNVTLEALASGLPIIGTNSGGTPEILDQGRIGVLCEPRSSEALAQAMLRLSAEPSHRQTLASLAREKALREFDMGKVFSRVEALVRRN